MFARGPVQFIIVGFITGDVHLKRTGLKQTFATFQREKHYDLFWLNISRATALQIKVLSFHTCWHISVCFNCHSFSHVISQKFVNIIIISSHRYIRMMGFKKKVLLFLSEVKNWSKISDCKNNLRYREKIFHESMKIMFSLATGSMLTNNWSGHCRWSKHDIHSEMQCFVNWTFLKVKN